MNPWSVYQSRVEARGATRRGAAIQRERAFLNAKQSSSLSYHEMTINGEQRKISVLNSDDLSIKTICSLPGENLPHGGLVHWMDNFWLIIETDANTEIYSKAIMRQCNHLLRWISDDNTVVERWCIVEDGTKYLTGEYGDNNYIITRGDSRISLILAKDKYSIRLNRDNRFLIDEYDSPSTLAYRLTKPFKLGGSTNKSGILSFVLTECNTEDSDNLELHIANYYDHFPKCDGNGVFADEQEKHGQDKVETRKRVWL